MSPIPETCKAAVLVEYGRPLEIQEVAIPEVGPGAIVELARGGALQLDVAGATHVRNIAKGPTFRFGVSVSR